MGGNLLCKRHAFILLLVEVDEGLAVFVEGGQLDCLQELALAVDRTVTERKVWVVISIWGVLLNVSMIHSCGLLFNSSYVY